MEIAHELESVCERGREWVGEAGRVGLQVSGWDVSSPNQNF